MQFLSDYDYKCFKLAYCLDILLCVWTVCVCIFVHVLPVGPVVGASVCLGLTVWVLSCPRPPTPPSLTRSPRHYTHLAPTHISLTRTPHTCKYFPHTHTHLAHTSHVPRGRPTVCPHVPSSCCLLVFLSECVCVCVLALSAAD